MNPTPPTLKKYGIPDGTKEARCHCGHLMAKLRKEGVELKCKRCKRIIILPFNAHGAEGGPFTLCRA